MPSKGKKNKIFVSEFTCHLFSVMTAMELLVFEGRRRVCTYTLRDNSVIAKYRMTQFVEFSNTRMMVCLPHFYKA